MVITYYSRVWINPGKVAIPARGQLNKEKQYFAVFPFAPENSVSLDRFGRPVPRQSARFPQSG